MAHQNSQHKDILTFVNLENKQTHKVCLLLSHNFSTCSAPLGYRNPWEQEIPQLELNAVPPLASPPTWAPPPQPRASIRPAPCKQAPPPHKPPALGATTRPRGKAEQPRRAGWAGRGAGGAEQQTDSPAVRQACAEPLPPDNSRTAADPPPRSPRPPPSAWSPTATRHVPQPHAITWLPRRRVARQQRAYTGSAAKLGAMAAAAGPRLPRGRRHQQQLARE